MLPDGFSRRDSMLVLSAMLRISSITTAEGVSGRIGTQEVTDALERMERPEDFWDLLFAYSDDRIFDLEKESRGDVRFTVAEVQAHDAKVYLHQNRDDLESYETLEKDEVVAEALGEHIFDHFIEAKKREWSEYIAQVHEWELERYLGAY